MSTVADPLLTAGLRRLPVDADEGFPQSFLLALEELTYRVELYVDVPEHLLPPRPAPRDVIDVVGAAPSAGEPRDATGLLVAAIARQQTDGVLVPLLRRRLLPGLMHTASELVLIVDDVRIAAGNLNGAGQFGSVVEARVGVR